MSDSILDIEKASHKELLKEWEKVQDLWGKYSCDCLGFYVSALHKRIVELGGWKCKN